MVIAAVHAEYPRGGSSAQVPQAEIGLDTGMRPSEQYRLRWEHVSFERKTLTVVKSKNGKVRHIPLNATALPVLKFVQGRATRE